MKTLRTSTQRGFTLIEIMVVVVIIGVLGAIVVPQFMSRPDQAKVTAARTDIQARLFSAQVMVQAQAGPGATGQQALPRLGRAGNGVGVKVAHVVNQ